MSEATNNAIVKEFLNYITLIAKEWILWIFLILDFISFIIQFIYPPFKVPPFVKQYGNATKTENKEKDVKPKVLSVKPSNREFYDNANNPKSLAEYHDHSYHWNRFDNLDKSFKDNPD